MTQCASIGTYSALAISLGGGLTFNNQSKQYEFLEESIKMNQEYAGGKGIRGTRSRNGSRTRIVAERVSGSIILEPTPQELEQLLPLFMGDGAKSGTTFALKEVLPKFAVLVDKVVRRFGYDNCVVGKATITGSKKQPIRLKLDIEGKSETQYTNTFASYGVPAIDGGVPYVLSDAMLSLNGDDNFEMESFELVIDNMLDADRFMNSVNRNCIPANDRSVMLSVGLPFSATTLPFHDLPVAGIQGSIELSMGTSSTTFDFVKMQAPADTPTAKRAAELMLPLKFECLSTATNNELIITHTP